MIVLRRSGFPMRQDMDAVEEYVLIGCRMQSSCPERDSLYALDRPHGAYERLVLDDVSSHLLGIPDALPREDNPFREGGSVCAISYRRPQDRNSRRNLSTSLESHSTRGVPSRKRCTNDVLCINHVKRRTRSVCCPKWAAFRMHVFTTYRSPKSSSNNPVSKSWTFS